MAANSSGCNRSAIGRDGVDLVWLHQQYPVQFPDSCLGQGLLALDELLQITDSLVVTLDVQIVPERLAFGCDSV